VRKVLLAIAALIAVLLPSAVPSQAAIPAVGAISHNNMEWKWNVPADVGSDIEFFERKLSDGSLKRYAVVGDMGHGFNIIEITNPDLPLIVGAFVDPGFNWEADIQVNPRRNLVLLATDNLGSTVDHGGGTEGIGVDIVDITDVTNPTLLSHFEGVEGAHNVTIINDQYFYTLLPTYIIDYSDPRNPKNLGQAPQICGHDLTVDQNNQTIAYSACPTSGNNLQIVDISDPAHPVVIKNVHDAKVSIGHQADPAPDSSFVVLTDERGGGLTNETCPGGGAHVYDISGKYVPGASLSNPKEMGHWFAPFYSPTDPTAQRQWGNCTIHVLTFQAERFLMSVAHYSAGTWVADMQFPTKTTGGLYQEFQGTTYGGPTSWGNTVGNFLPEGANTWSSKWTRFDDPKFDRYVFTQDITRGMDVFYYTGPMPKKVARLRIDPQESGGAVTGTLDRYAVLTYLGWVNKPLANVVVTVTANGQTVGATTGPDGTFSASLGLTSGSVQVTVAWPGDDQYQAASLTQTVSA
jgi:hypothetical protein